MPYVNNYQFNMIANVNNINNTDSCFNIHVLIYKTYDLRPINMKVLVSTGDMKFECQSPTIQDNLGSNFQTNFYAK